MVIKCKHCGCEIKNCHKLQKYHKKCFKEYKKLYSKQRNLIIKNNWKNLSDDEQLDLLNKKAKEILNE